MKFRQYFLVLIFLLSYAPIFAQGVYEAWVARYNGPGLSYDEPTDLAVDNSGNVYVTGFSGTIKYSANGDSLWFGVYGGYDLAIDDSGNVYVTGGGLDAITIKYSSSGDTLWVRRYNGPGNYYDVAYALAIDDSGNVYVAGCEQCYAINAQYITIKYNSAGDTLWVRRYPDLPGNYDGSAHALAVDDSGNVYVTGKTPSGDFSDDYATIKYSSFGDTLWVRRYHGTGNGHDGASGLAVDAGGNVYVTGWSVGSGTSEDYATIKYSPFGDTLWVRRYNGPGNFNDAASALAIDGSGNVYVTGWSWGSENDYATIKYSPAGDALWVRRYDGPGNGDDFPTTLAVDGGGNVYVTGYNYSGGTSQDYITVKYSSAGDSLWVRRYNGPGNDDDRATALAVDDSGNVYVAGTSYSNNITGSDYATIKYSPCSAKPGDVTGDGLILLNDIVAVINDIFRGAPSPNPFCRGDANGDGSILLTDVIYLVNRVFKSGPEPVKSGQCCL